MAGNGGELTLGDLVTLQRGTTYKSALLGQPGPVLLGLASIQRNGGFRNDNLKTYGGDSPDKLLLRPGDIYVSLKDVTQSADLLGAIARVPPHIRTGRVTQDTVKLTFVREDVSSRYVYWLLRTPVYREYCRAHAIGTTNLSIAREDFLAFPIPRPSARELTIVETLDALDDKIELNRRMNATLEATARALFQSWFVDFDPVRAKLDGRQTTGLDPATSALFPEHFDHKVGTIVPNGWNRKRWGDIATLEYGKSLRDYRAEGGKYRVFGTNGPIGFHHEALCNSAGIVIGRKGAYRGIHYSRDPFFVIDTAFYLKPKTPFDLKWAYYELLRFDINSMDSGSAIPSTSREDFYGIPVVVPPVRIQDAFGKIVGGWFAKAFANAQESRTLATLRDTLLPKLLTGENRILSPDSVL
jgi:type I restriction enzyme, S subunit